MQLSQFYVITSDDFLSTAEFLQRLQRCLDRGYRLIQLRVKHLAPTDYQALAQKVVALAQSYQAKIILNTNSDITTQVQADGMHLSAQALMQLTQRSLAGTKLVSAACHNEHELVQAQQLRVDFVTLSPVLATQTHPQQKPLGWVKFKELCRLVDMPVYALGGLHPKDLEVALAHGAYGIAAIRSLWLTD